jgi:hypothetical protein
LPFCHERGERLALRAAWAVGEHREFIASGDVDSIGQGQSSSRDHPGGASGSRFVVVKAALVIAYLTDWVGWSGRDLGRTKTPGTQSVLGLNPRARRTAPNAAPVFEEATRVEKTS